jgi:sugar (pentulose or hexulose) kinase
VEVIVPVAHGAAIAGLKDGAPAFDPPDYEGPLPAESLAAYRRGRDAFGVTGSPALPAGLNLGAQLHGLEAATGGFDGITLLPYAQYWAWWLSGTAVSEVTSLGCHSDLWEPAAGTFSPMARARGWADRFAPMAQAGDVIGTLRPDLARQTGLSRHIRVHAGIHDSNAALNAARGFAEIAGLEATVLSTGTWFIAMRSPAAGAALPRLDEARDCLVNVDARGAPVPSARWMGGRVVEQLGHRIDRAGTAGLEAVLDRGIMALPGPGGPLADAPGGWIGEPANGDEAAAAVALMAALCVDAMLDLLESRDRLLVEGRFAASEVMVAALAALRPGMAVLTATEEADVSFGALRLALPELAPPGRLTRAAPLPFALEQYRARWRAAIARTGEARGET